MTLVNILHLADIHFGAEKTPAKHNSPEINDTNLAKRTNVLDGLVKQLKSSYQDQPLWKPNVVVISGDIGWKGNKSDYEQAQKWLSLLLDILNLSPKELILSPGNHDIDRNKTVGISPPQNKTEADEWLKIENLENFVRPFEAYTSFCKTFGIPELTIGSEKHYLMGQREINDLKFVVLNSSWFSRGDNDKGKLWIGFPQLELMQASHQLIDPDNYDSGKITIATLHHPFSWLHAAEHETPEGRQLTSDHLSERCHIILSGHTHTYISQPRRQNNAYLFNGGSSYAGSDYWNNFSIHQINLDNRTTARRAFEYDPRHGKWEEKAKLKETYDLKKNF